MPTTFEAGLLIFGLVFAVELVDRTNIAVIVLATRHPARLVWTGAAIGFVAITAVSVLLGGVAVVFLLPYLLWVKVVAGIAIIGAGIHEVLEPAEDEAKSRAKWAARAGPQGPLGVIGSVASLILVLEIGDETQILAIGFVVATAQPFLVYAAVTLALVGAAAVGARLGRFLKDRVNPSKLRKGAGAVFIVVGMAVVLFAFFPNLLPPILG